MKFSSRFAFSNLWTQFGQKGVNGFQTVGYFRGDFYFAPRCEIIMWERFPKYSGLSSTF